jgi:Cu+-exporting ATPase
MKEIKVKNISLPIEGMTCASCVSRVEKTIAKFEGVLKVSVNLASEKALIEYNPDVIDFVKLAKLIDDSGYKLDLSPLQKKENSPIKPENKIDAHLKKLKSELIFAAVLSIPILIINMGIMWQDFFPNNLLSADYINKILLILTTPVIFVSGKRFFKIFWNNLKHFTADMNSLVAIGTGSAYLFSLTLTLFPKIYANNHSTHHVFFDTTVVIITLILFGKWLESRAKFKTGTAIQKLIELQPKTAIVKEHNREVEKKLIELKTGDIIVIKPGSKIPADGIVISGSSSVNEAMITGESLPVKIMAGSKVIGGTINQTGYFEFEITVLGNNSVLGQIIKLVEEAQGSKAPIQNLADKVASVFVPVVVVVAIITFIVWFFIKPYDLSFALMNFVAVLIIACPCALGLATPAALIVGMGKGAQNGILFKNGECIERLSKADTIIFDKTGTITEGKLSLNKIFVKDISESEFISLLASLEIKSEHPIAKTIINYAEEKKISLVTITEFESKPGKGIKGKINNDIILAGSESFLRENKIDLASFFDIIKKDSANISSATFLAINNSAKGFVTVTDLIKSNSGEEIKKIKNSNFKTVLLSGDNEQVTTYVSKLLAIDEYESKVLPEDKSNIVKKFQSGGKIVVMVGDGINDAPALVQADVGIAIGTGTDVAIESAQVVLINGNLAGVAKSIILSKETIRIIKQNLFWAFIYNIIGIPLAAIGLLNPMFAAIAMSLSSVSVISNSLRLKKIKL